jgi:hypothetical protein
VQLIAADEHWCHDDAKDEHVRGDVNIEISGQNQQSGCESWVNISIQVLLGRQHDQEWSTQSYHKIQSDMHLHSLVKLCAQGRQSASQDLIPASNRWLASETSERVRDSEQSGHQKTLNATYIFAAKPPF